MKKFIKILALILTMVTLISSVACSSSGFKLSHFDGSDLSNGYDTDLLYKNNSNLLGGDSGVIWVSEEQDPIYGGYFYQYQSSTLHIINESAGNLSGTPSTEDGKTPTNSEDIAYISHIATTRSKDLNDWELCGALDNGLSLKLLPDSWVYTYIWAAEVIYDPVSERYFMYFNANDSGRNSKSFYGGVAVSNTPVGPFELVTSENMYGSATATNPNGEILTHTKAPINFEKWYGLPENSEEYEYVADFHPMLDDNGDLYLYFNKRNYDPSYSLSVWGVKMKDFATPDYSTITCMVHASNSDGTWSPVRSVYKGKVENNTPITSKDALNTTYINDPEYPRYLASSYDHLNYWADGTQNTKTLPDGSVNPDFNGYNGINGAVVREGIQVFRNKDKNGKTVYYAAFTFVGVGSSDYDVHWASSYSPLGAPGDEFTLPKGTGTGLVLGVDINNDFMSNMGHVQFLNVDGEWWIAHWEWTVPFYYSSSTDIGRIYALTQMTWIEKEGYDYYIPVANGPSTHLQPLPSIYTGYKNVAIDASITATKANDNTIKYLNDGLVVTMYEWRDRQFTAKAGTTITLTFDTPKTVRGILIYNSYSEDSAFANIKSIQFDLSETPTWRKAGNEKTCYIYDLGFNATKYQAGSASVATFNEIKVNKITITIDDLLNGADQLKISEIKVLGK